MEKCENITAAILKLSFFFFFCSQAADKVEEVKAHTHHLLSWSIASVTDSQQYNPQNTSPLSLLFIH